MLLFGCILTVISFDTLFPLGTKFLIDKAIVPGDARMFMVLVVGLASLYLISSAGSVGQDYLTAWVTAHVSNDMRLQMYSHLQSLPAGYYARLQLGDVITRFNTDLTAIEYGLIYSVLMGVQCIIQLLMSIVVLFMLNVPLGLLTVAIMPFTAVIPKFLAGRASRLVVQRRAVETDITTVVQDTIHAQAVNRMFGLRERTIAAFSRQLERFASIFTLSSFVGWEVNRVTIIGQYLIQLLVIAIGAYLALVGKLSVGSLVGFTSLLINVGYAISLVSTAWSSLIPAVPSLERVESLLNEKPQTDGSPDVILPRFSRDLRFDGVTFSYGGPSARPNLENVSFSITSGQSVAFIGRSGSGKSTVLNLLMRFYDPCGGHILLDGRDIQEVGLASLRSQMGVVFQDTFLYNTTLRENIRMGKVDASDAEVEEAARAAGVHEAILCLPDGYNTLAGEQGKGLSGGQRQRIALARAIIRRPAILLLDEATSALDPETEMRIGETLRNLRRSCTILSVTHRLAPVADMDQIVVLDQGQVVEAGSHENLMNRHGLYYQMYTQQSGFMVSSDGLYAEISPSRLRGIPLFEALDEPSLEKFVSQFVTERYEPGKTVIQEGEVGDKFYIIVRGKVSVTVSSPDQQPIDIGTMQDGDYFGEIALLEEGRRTATVCTLLPSLFLTLERKHFMNMLESYPAVRAAVEQTAKARLVDSTSRIATPGS